ncbi:hypothetical protein ACYOEI_10925 [Singulisphaera rosea]
MSATPSGGMTAVISCPHCLRQYEADPSLEGRLGQCGSCLAQFAISVPTLKTDGADPVVFRRSIGPSYAFFREGCETLARNVSSILIQAGLPVTPGTVMSFIRSMPRDRDDLSLEEWRHGFCNQALKEGYVRCDGEESRSRFRVLVEYFCDRIPNMPKRTLDMLTDAFVGILSGIHWEDGAVASNPVAGREEPESPGLFRRWADSLGFGTFTRSKSA